MPLQFVSTSQEQLVSTPVITALREGVDAAGQAVLLVRSFTQALDAQRMLAQEPGLSLSVTVTTPQAWAKERWEVWGDGRVIADGPVLAVLAYQTLREATNEERGPIELSVGMVRVLAKLAGSSLPWLPLADDGSALEDRCRTAGLTAAETRLISLAGALRARLRRQGRVSMGEVYASVPQLLGAAKARMPHVVLAGAWDLARGERELVRGLAELAPVTVVANVAGGEVSATALELASWFNATIRPVRTDDAEPRVVRDPGLDALLSVLYTGNAVPEGVTVPVELLEAAGPVAESELIARHVAELVADPVAQTEVVIVTPDVARAKRELLPKLAARGIGVRLQWSRALADCPAAQAFFGYAQTVAYLSELAAHWPTPEPGIEGPVSRLGDMSWWPPRELTDFLLSDMAHIDPAAAWRLDAQWRGNRLLKPADVLETLQSERDVSAPVARATAELLRGRVGTAASKLLVPYANKEGRLVNPDDEGETCAVLQAVLQLAGTLKELGITADPSVPGALSTSELVELCIWASEGVSVVTRMGAAPKEGMPTVRVMTPSAAAACAPRSLDSLVVCGMTTVEMPIAPGDDLLSAVLELLGVEHEADSMLKARNEFRALLALPRTRLVLERALHDSDSKVTYPAVMLSETLSACGVEAGECLPIITRSETVLAENLASTGTATNKECTDEPAPAGRLESASRAYVFVPQDGTDLIPDGKPVLSASQIETYLDCPYKWFSLRRLRLGTVDAGHGAMEMGTFAHRVLEVTHREILLRALEAEAPGVPREELIAAIEADPVRHVEGSRVTQENLEAARAALELEFDLHREHMYLIRRPRQGQQLLVPHDATEEAQERRLRDDLLSALGYQTGILTGFEPRLFEWGFGRHGKLVEYAGAYFTGTVDRIDVSPHGTAVIIDYKHKAPAGFAGEYDALQEGVVEGESLPRRVQSLIYAQVVRRAFEGRLRLVGTVYLSTKSPHALAGAADEDIVDLVFGRVSAKRLPQVAVPRAEGGGPGMDALLDRTEELVAEQVSRMLSGDIEARPRDKASCDFCPVMGCERRVAR